VPSPPFQIGVVDRTLTDLVRFIDKRFHPIYLRLVEGVLSPFVSIIAFFSRLNRNKPARDIAIFQAVEELSHTPLASLQELYSQTIRNAIAHGGISYLDSEVLYRSKKQNGTIATEEMTFRGIVTLVDNLLDACNGLALAMKVFFLVNLHSFNQIPQQIMFEELQGETDTSWWHLEGFVRSEMSSKTQLIIYARAKTSDYDKVHYSALSTAILAEALLPGFQRYFLSIRSPRSLPGFAAFDGLKISQVREEGPMNLEAYKGVIENDLIFYSPKFKMPRILSKLDTMVKAFLVMWDLARAELPSRFGLPSITVRDIEIHRNGWHSIMNGAVVVSPADGIIDSSLIKRVARRIMRSACREARDSLPVYAVEKWLPLGYARIAVFCKNNRQRKLANYGLGPCLICTIQVNALTRIKVPDIFGSTIEKSGKYRIAWNHNWLKSLDDSVSSVPLGPTIGLPPGSP
jgi:hypothetical protein